MKNFLFISTLAGLIGITDSSGSLVKKIKPTNEKEIKADTSYEIIDLMPRFWKFWENAEGIDQPAKLELFKREVMNADKEIYALVPGNLTDNRINNYLSSIPSSFSAMHEVGDRLPGLLKQSWKNFAAAFPDIKGKTMLIAMPSIGSFNGMSKKLNGNAALLFGIDQMAKDNHPGFNYIPQIQHEIAHLYHAQKAPGILGNFAMYNDLWQEGMAVYISKLLNPKATNTEIYLYDSMPGLVKPIVPELAREIHQKLYAENWDEKKPYFSMGTGTKDKPERCGYYIGMLVVEDLLKKYPLDQLITFSGNSLAMEIEKALTRLESSH